MSAAAVKSTSTTQFANGGSRKNAPTSAGMARIRESVKRFGKLVIMTGIRGGDAIRL